MSLNDYIEQREKEEANKIAEIMERNSGLEAIAQCHYDNKQSINALETKAHKFLDLYLETGEVEKELVGSYERALKNFKKTKIKTKRKIHTNYGAKLLIEGTTVVLTSLGLIGAGYYFFDFASVTTNVVSAMANAASVVAITTGSVLTLASAKEIVKIIKEESRLELKLTGITLKRDLSEYIANLQQLNLYTRTLQQQTEDMTLVDPIQAEYLEKRYGLQTLKNKVAEAQKELQKTADITSKLLTLTNTPQLPIPQNTTKRIAEELETSPIASAIQRLTSKQNQAPLSSALRANDDQPEQQ